MTEHDANICQCSQGTAQDFFQECSCPCPRCQEYRDKSFRLKKLLDLDERLKRANIDVCDLADLILMRMDAQLEERIERLMKPCLTNWLRNVKFSTTVHATNIEEFF